MNWNKASNPPRKQGSYLCYGETCDPDLPLYWVGFWCQVGWSGPIPAPFRDSMSFWRELDKPGVIPCETCNGRGEVSKMTCDGWESDVCPTCQDESGTAPHVSF